MGTNVHAARLGVGATVYMFRVPLAFFFGLKANTLLNPPPLFVLTDLEGQQAGTDIVTLGLSI